MRRLRQVTRHARAALVAPLALALWAGLGTGARAGSTGASVAPVEKLVRGDSLAPLLKSGDAVQVLEGYYGDHRVERGDLVVIRWAGRQSPLLKIARGLPGDALSLERAPGSKGWHLWINGRAARNSEGRPYLLDERAQRMTGLYVRDYGGTIPAESYLVLGDQPSGSLDSTRFGLIHRSALVGKAIRR